MGKILSTGCLSTTISGMKIDSSIPCNTSNYQSAKSRQVDYIVIHYTAGNKDTAKGNCNYFASNAGLYASAHFFVDNTSIYQSVKLKDIAWHCGTKYTFRHPSCRNINAIGIEMCCTQERYVVSEKTKNNSIALCAYLCKLLGITASEVDSYVLRHYDVTGKLCPAQMATDANDEWTEFKNKVKKILQPSYNESVVTATASSLSEEDIWNLLLCKIPNEYAVAGIMGNMYAESGLKPNNLQNGYEGKLGYTDDTYTKAVDSGVYNNFVRDGAGYGLVQWTYYTLKQALLNYAKKNNASIGDGQMQIEFLCQELKNDFPTIWKNLNAATSATQASNIMLLQFEKPANQDTSVQKKRAEYAEKYYTKYHIGNKDSVEATGSNYPEPPFLIRTSETAALNVRSGPGVTYTPTMILKGDGVYTIIEVQNSCWGKLKSGAGWINLKYTKKI